MPGVDDGNLVDANWGGSLLDGSRPVGSNGLAGWQDDKVFGEDGLSVGKKVFVSSVVAVLEGEDISGDPEDEGDNLAGER